jgi:hypothetical protein
MSKKGKEIWRMVLTNVQNEIGGNKFAKVQIHGKFRLTTHREFLLKIKK